MPGKAGWGRRIVGATPQLRGSTGIAETSRHGQNYRSRERHSAYGPPENTMIAVADEKIASVLNVAELADRFGPMSLARIRTTPPPGTATESDFCQMERAGQALCELIDGVLLEKAVGYTESMLAIQLAHILLQYVSANRCGIILGADGPFRLHVGQIRMPDVAFVSKKRLGSVRPFETAVLDVIPNLAVEILSPSNTEREMTRKKNDYFSAGVELVWYIWPQTRTVEVFTAPDSLQTLSGNAILTGGDVLPGFELPLSQLFAVLDLLS